MDRRPYKKNTANQANVKTHEWKLVAWSAIYFFCLLCGYFILRPLRDEMGILNGAIHMQWLFTGTFVAMLCVVPVFGYVVTRYSIGKVLLYAYSFFIGCIFLFYLFFTSNAPSQGIAISFFIWLSVFNLFVVSLFWSFMADLFDSTSSKRYFGVIASGGSLGALMGPVVAHQLSAQFKMENLLLAAIFFMIIALCSILALLRLSNTERFLASPEKKTTINIKVLFEGVQSIVRSKYLLGIVGYVLLYTSISTVLYFEQAHIVEDTITDSANRIAYFSKLDFTINAIAITGQFFLTARIIQRIGLSLVLASIPLLMGVGLLVLGQKTSLGVIAILMVFHRSGNFMLLRPGREILFTVTGFKEKYKAKNLIDTAIYRGGDAIVGWLFSGLTALGLGLGAIAFVAVPLSFLWSLMGFRLGRHQRKKENALTLKNRLYEKHV